jgi:DNA-binding NtrC family response regulator
MEGCTTQRPNLAADTAKKVTPPMNLLWITNAEQFPADRLLAAALHLPCDFAFSASDALARLEQKGADAVIIQAPLHDCCLEDLTEAILEVDGRLPVVARHGQGTISEAVRFLRLGGCTYLGPEQSGPDALLDALQSALAVRGVRAHRRFAADSDEPWRKHLVGQSGGMRNVVNMVRMVASRRASVLITGETGTGKEMVAKAIHQASSRSGAQMVSLNCAAFPEHLLEAELFGHTRGAFTGATGPRTGRIEQAHRGTLFLDEIADLPLGMQTKLLRVLQEREFERLGSSETTKVDFRLIAACNVDLEERIEAGRFREDLYYRLNVFPVQLPPLRERREDIPLLVDHFVRKVCIQEEVPLKRVSDEAMARLCAQSWPGNVRQLENAVEMAVTLSEDREILYPSDFRLPPQMERRFVPAALPALPALPLPESGLDYERVVEEFEKNLLAQALEKSQGNKKQAADILRLKRTTFAAKLKTLQLAAGA